MLFTLASLLLKTYFIKAPESPGFRYLNPESHISKAIVKIFAPRGSDGASAGENCRDPLASRKRYREAKYRQERELLTPDSPGHRVNAQVSVVTPAQSRVTSCSSLIPTVCLGLKTFPAHGALSAQTRQVLGKSG